MIEVKDCKRGYILKGIENHKVIIIDGIKVRGHFIVFYQEYDGNDFIGAMITSTDFNDTNVKMIETYFRETDEFNNKCTVVYNNSFLVPAKLHKFHSMGPFQLVGQLTEEGIGFVTEVIDDLPVITWQQYNS